MSIEAELPDGTVLEFPDGTHPDVMQAAVRKQMGVAAAPSPQSLPGEPAPRESADAPTQVVPEGQRPTSQLLGFIKGVADPTKKLQGFDPARAVAGMVDPQLAQGLDRQSEIGRQGLTDAEQQQKPGLLGQIAGGMALTAPTFAMGPLAGGAATGAALSDKTDLGGVGIDTILGALGGKLGQSTINGAGKLIAPKVSGAARALMDRGVNLTPGQMLGGVAKSLEDKATSVPFLGDMIQSARTRGLQDWNRSIYNDVLEPLGETLPKGVKAGQDAFNHIYEKLGDAYDKVIPKTTTTLDNDFVDHLQKAVAPIVQTMTPDGQAQFANILKQRVLSRFSSGAAKGDIVKEVTSELGNLASNFSSAADGNQRLLGQAIISLQQGVKDATARQNPLVAPILKKIDQSYSMLAGLRGAASSTAAEGGVFTPKQLQMASKAADKSVGKNTTARGRARYQEAAQLAQEILPSKVPDSGTVGRGIAAALPSLVAGGAAALHPGMAIAGLAGTLPYTKIGQQVMRGAFSPGPVRQTARGALDMLANPAGAIAALIASQGAHQ